MKTILSALIFLSTTLAFAQDERTTCPAAAKNLHIAGNFMEDHKTDLPTKPRTDLHGSRTGPVYIIPVVFHIIHDGGPELISDTMVYREIEHMNEYMSATNPGLNTVVASFDTLIGDAQIEFRLAQRDPHGVCTNGIDRIYSQAAYVGTEYSKINPWPRDKYLNIWITKGIDKDYSFYGAIGYALYPSAVAGSPDIDGIMAKYFVVSGSQAYQRPTITHEAGHWLDLRHLGYSCSDDDFVADTPPMIVNNNCNLTQSICNPPVVENVQNIMNGDNCSVMFTKGQVDRMHNTLHSTIAGRDNIWTQNNLLATGTDVANPVSCASPVADFSASRRIACIGDTVYFQDASYNAAITSRHWTFPVDAAVSSDVDARPYVIFSSDGWKEVSLQAFGANGSDQKTKQMIYVANETPITAPFFEGFEDPNSPTNLWKSINYDNNATSFQLYTSGGHSSSRSYKLNSIDAKYEGDVDQLVSPVFDLTGLDTTGGTGYATFSFDYSFASADASHTNDSASILSVLATRDCGRTWQTIFALSGAGLINAGTQTTSYAAGQGDEYWRNVQMAIPAAYRTAMTRFKIQLSSGTGINNFYIDNINVGMYALGVNDAKAAISAIDILPNPSQGDATIVISASSATIDMYDAQGRLVQTIYSGALASGTVRIPIAVSALSSGVYTIRLSDGRSVVQRRFVKI